MEEKKTIREVREEKGIKAGYVAECLGLSKQKYSNRESGRTKFKVAEAIKACDVLGVDIKTVEF